MSHSCQTALSWADGQIALSLQDIRHIVRTSETRHYPAGTMLCEEDTLGDCTFFIRRGTVEIFKTSRGRPRVLAHRTVGEMVGEMALFEQRTRTASAVAIGPVRALVLHSDRMTRLLNRHPQLALLLLQTMSHRLRSVQQDLLDDLILKVEALEAANEHLEARVADRTRELQESNNALERAIVSDYLTGCYNRRWLMEQLDRWCRSARPLGVVLVDIDHFKHYNDTNGHLMGDDLLRGFVGVVQGQIRPGDAVARYGGEEFVLLLHGATPEIAREVAERVRARVAAEPFHAAARQPLGRISISAGVATLPEDGQDPSELLRIADGRLYQGKENGRNRVVASSHS